MIVLTSGKKYLDIDGYASALAYRELFKLRGIETKFVSNATLNASITLELRKLNTLDNYIPTENDKFIILDLQNPDYIPEFVNQDNIIELIDHHSGYEDYWKSRLEDNAIIERVGAAATLIYEKYIEYHLENKITENIAKVLCAAILDNTLNFSLNLNHNRDKVAYDKLLPITNDKHFKEHYFQECEDIALQDIESTIDNDLKYVDFKLIDAIGQINIWNSKDILNDTNKLITIMNKYTKRWLLKIGSIKDKKTFLLYSHQDIKDYLEKHYQCITENNVLIVNKLLTRYDLMQIFKKN